MEQHAERVASTIRAELARRKIPHSRLVSVLGISRAAVGRRLAGDVSWRVDELCRIADLLDVPLSTLMDDQTKAAS